jgi:hypothetical protein
MIPGTVPTVPVSDKRSVPVSVSKRYDPEHWRYTAALQKKF